MKKVHEEAGAALKRIQEEIKKYVDCSRRETEEWKRGDRMLLSTKDLVFKERPVSFSFGARAGSDPRIR